MTCQGRPASREEDLRPIADLNRRLDWVLEQTGVGLWFNELPFGRLNWDRQTRELFFVPPEAEATIELFWSRVHPDDREPTWLAIDRAIAQRTLYQIDHRTVEPVTGRVRWIHSAGQATYAADGTPTRFDGINFDITDRREAEEQIRHLSRELFAAQDRERRQIAHDLHETTGQQLSALTMWLAKLEQFAAHCPPDARAALTAAMDLAQACSREVRSLSYALYPPLLNERGLVAAVRWFVEDFEQRSGVPVALEMPGEIGRLDEALELTVFRILQECLTNVHRHAQASRALVELKQGRDSVTLVVEDNGRGMADVPRSAWGVGLRAVQERVRHLNGELEVDRRRDGTRIRARLPVAGGKR